MTAADRSDLELVRLAQDGDIAAFAALVRRHEPRLRTVLFRLLDDARDVEEAVQDCFLQAWRNLDRFRGDAAVFTWLYRIGVNEALARRRRREPRIVDVESVEGGASSTDPRLLPGSAAEVDDLRARIVAALAALPFEYREAVVLRDVAGLSNAEVAAALDLSLAAAKSRIHRARLQLRDALEPSDDH